MSKQIISSEFAISLGKSNSYFHDKTKRDTPIHFNFLIWKERSILVDLDVYDKAISSFMSTVNRAHDIFYEVEERGLLGKVAKKMFGFPVSEQNMTTALFFPIDDEAFLSKDKYINIHRFILAAEELLQNEEGEEHYEEIKKEMEKQ